jgi:hypothetical protein
MAFISILLSTTVFLTDLLYLHLFAFYQTFKLLFNYNSANESTETDKAKLKHMLTYWIAFVLSSFIQGIWGF